MDFSWSRVNPAILVGFGETTGPGSPSSGEEPPKNARSTGSRCVCGVVEEGLIPIGGVAGAVNVAVESQVSGSSVEAAGGVVEEGVKSKRTVLIARHIVLECPRPIGRVLGEGVCANRALSKTALRSHTRKARLC